MDYYLKFWGLYCIVVFSLFGLFLLFNHTSRKKKIEMFKKAFSEGFSFYYNNKIYRKEDGWSIERNILIRGNDYVEIEEIATKYYQMEVVLNS